MALNWKEIDLVLSEMGLEGSLIRQIYGPDHRSLVFDLYNLKRGSRRALKLFISLANPHCRLHALTHRLENPKTPKRFTTFLRAHVRGGRIISAAQPMGQRIVRLEVTRGGRELTLWVRLWASAANLIVTDHDNTILDAFYRRPKRGETAGHKFKPDLAAPDARAETFTVRELAGTGRFNERLEAYYREMEAGEELQRLTKAADKALRTRENSLLLKLEGLHAQKARREQAERWRQLGDLIKGSLYKIAPGDAWLEAQDYFNDGDVMKIELDTSITPAQNAESYYDRYKREKKRLARIEETRNALDAGLATIRRERQEMAGSCNLELLRNLVRKSGRPKKKGQRTAGLLFKSSQFQILVGRTSRGNDVLLRKHVNGNDYWFHCRDYPGAYVFVKSMHGKSIPLGTMIDAGNLAVFYSKGKQSEQGDIYYTQVKYLRRAKDGKAGLVIPTSEKNLFIKLDSDRLKRLQQTKSPY